MNQVKTFQSEYELERFLKDTQANPLSIAAYATVTAHDDGFNIGHDTDTTILLVYEPAHPSATRTPGYM